MTTTPVCLTLTPLKPGLAAGIDNSVDLLVRLIAPAAPPPSRRGAALSLALVIDRSSSMSGQPLHEAKRCAGFVVDRLGPTDRCAIVCYDNEVQTLVPSRPAGDKDVFRAAIDEVRERGSTNLHGGWLAGARALAPHTALAGVSRVLLLSDGQANFGLTEPAAIFRECAELAACGVTTSTYGLGHGFNEVLMQGIAQQGGGNAYYGRTAEDLLDPFQEELDLLGDLCARSAILQVLPAPGIGVEVVNGLLARPGRRWQLPALAHDSEAWALVRLTVPAGLVLGAGALQRLAEVRVDCEAPDGMAIPVQAQTLELPVLSAADASRLDADPLVARRSGELEAARLQVAARDAARAGDWARVGGLLDEARAAAAGNAWIEGIVGTLEALASRGEREAFAKEAAYSARQVGQSLKAREDMVLATRPRYLREKTEQGRGQSR